jgi:formate/nitrite transporter FocA (FNT family)
VAASKQQEAQDIFEPIVEEGKTELERPFADLVVSGLIGGLGIGFGPVTVAVVAGRLSTWPT